MKENMKRYILLSIIVLIILSLFMTANNVIAIGSTVVETTGGNVTVTNSTTQINFGSSQERYILDQHNIYCAQRGPHTAASYNVGKQYYVSDPALAYILCNGPKSRTYYRTSRSQIAFWYYLKNRKSYDRNIITNNGSITQGSLTGLSNYNTGVKFYKDAVEYADEYYEFVKEKPAVEIKKDGTEYRIEITGNFKKFKLQINDEEAEIITREYDKINEIYKKYIRTITPDTTKETITVKVTPVFDLFAASYRILTNGAKQRLILVTGTTSVPVDGQCTIVTDKVAQNVSMEKFIMGVNLPQEEITTLTGDDTREDLATRTDIPDRWFRNDTSSVSDKQWISYSTITRGNIDENGKDITKFSNPVNIQKDDEVTYQIRIFDNNYMEDMEGVERTKEIYIEDYLSIVEYNNSETSVRNLEIGEGKDVEIVSIWAESSPQGENRRKMVYKREG